MIVFLVIPLQMPLWLQVFLASGLGMILQFAGLIYLVFHSHALVALLFGIVLYLNHVQQSKAVAAGSYSANPSANTTSVIDFAQSLLPSAGNTPLFPSTLEEGIIQTHELTQSSPPPSIAPVTFQPSTAPFSAQSLV
jgi:hypothetical protein